MKLSEYTQGRDNNFNLIRIFAASAVFVSHSFALSIGNHSEPLVDILGGKSLGSIAVDIFFLTSGFLVTASLLRRQNTIEFVWARILRIYPALLMMLILTVFGAGLFFTTVSRSSYLTHYQTYKYFLKCLSLINGVEYILPGVFGNNPYKNVVNGSLWTMPHELRMYAILALIWIFLHVAPTFRPKIFKIVIVASTLVAGFFVILKHLSIIEGSLFLRLFFMFFTGASYFIAKDRIVLSKTTFYFLWGALILASTNIIIFNLVYILILPYLLFYFAYIPNGMIRKYNKLGDYSYGVYIYAFPVQQSIAALIPDMSVFSMMIMSGFFTFFFSLLSWHFLEKNAIKLKELYSSHTKKILSFDLNNSISRIR